MFNDFYWLFYLFTFQILSLLLVFSQQTPYPYSYPLLLWGCSPTNLPTPTSLPYHSPMVGHQAFTGPSTSPPPDARQDYPLLHMRLKPWVTPCVLFGWWFSLWELWGVWLVHIWFIFKMDIHTCPCQTCWGLPVILTLGRWEQECGEFKNRPILKAENKTFPHVIIGLQDCMFLLAEVPSTSTHGWCLKGKFHSCFLQDPRLVERPIWTWPHWADFPRSEF